MGISVPVRLEVRLLLILMRCTALLEYVIRSFGLRSVCVQERAFCMNVQRSTTTRKNINTRKNSCCSTHTMMSFNEDVREWFTTRTGPVNVL